jgi:hypothetical protein
MNICHKIVNFLFYFNDAICYVFKIVLFNYLIVFYFMMLPITQSI